MHLVQLPHALSSCYNTACIDHLPITMPKESVEKRVSMVWWPLNKTGTFGEQLMILKFGQDHSFFWQKSYQE